MGRCATAETLARYFAGESDLREAAAVEAHAEGCSRCQEELACLAKGDLDVDWHQLRDHSTNPESVATSLQSLITCVMGDGAADNSPNESGIEAEVDPIRFPGPPTSQGPMGQLDCYHIIEELGRGSFGIVFKAYDADLDCIVAIKVLRSELAGDARERARFVREARAASAMDHDHVVTIHRVGGAPGFPPFIVMEYIDGESLRQRLAREGSLSSVMAATIVRQAALGLASADGRLVHRDVKPSNIMLSARSGRVKITDFGLARPLVDANATITNSGTILGTPFYMSPEQINGSRLVDARCDVYSLGVVLYESLTGEVPFRGSPHLVFARVVHEEPRPLRAFNGQIPIDLETIALRCLEKQPGRRFPTAGDLADELGRFLDRKPIVSRRTSPLERTLKWARRKPAWAALVAVTLLSTAALLGGAVWHLAQLRERNAQLELERATQQRLRGEAMDALNHLVYEVQEELAQVPGIDEVRQNLLRKAIEGLGRVVEESPTADETTTAALVRIGNIQLKLGQMRQAQEHFEKARRLVEAWPVKEGRPPLVLAEVYRGLGLCLGQEERTQESRDFLQCASEIAQAWVTDDPRSIPTLETTMNILNDLADTCRALADLPGAQSLFRRSAELGRGLPASPATVGARKELAYAWETLGEMCLDAGHPIAARTEFQRALELRTTLKQGLSYPSRNDVDLGLDLYELGRCDLQEGQGAAAEAQLIQAKVILEKQVALDPKRVRNHRLLAHTLRCLGEARHLQGDLEAAESFHRQAIEALGRIAAQVDGAFIPKVHVLSLIALGRFERATLHPQKSLESFRRALAYLNEASSAAHSADPATLDPIVSEVRAEIEACRAILNEMAVLGTKAPPSPEKDTGGPVSRAKGLACLGRHAEAAALAADFAQRASGDPESLYQVAVVYAMCRTSALRVPPETAPGRSSSEEVNSYTTSAVKSLNNAWVLGLNNPVRLRSDVDLASIRGTSELRDLLGQLPAE